MTTFKKVQKTADIRELIRSTFDVDLPLTGSWGYTEEEATIVEALPEGMPLLQLEHVFASIRAHLEMNITQEPENRYGGINLHEKEREQSKKEKSIFDKVTYEITAIKEDLYNAFIKEYKEGYGKEGFDLNDHFKRRKEATLTREVTHYFEVSALG
ncbi:hypothetical protein [Sulfurovum sp. NBC37-1]|uniref:hypothetical protein n=1 Tax=Sulfurovum sp. (strain NBC37-1) TaxID=387093 RepID=UPI000158778A|nr:hypothetical protein [Sulfurovum sp. NBC37-1]BAF71019.1 hypothetical protein SUN_0059 [Sulfurovum sp. NBC37-1]